MLKRIGACLWILTGHIASPIDLIETLVGQGGTTIAHKALHLTGQLIVDGEGHVVGAAWHKVGHQRRSWLHSVKGEERKELIS